MAALAAALIALPGATSPRDITDRAEIQVMQHMAERYWREPLRCRLRVEQVNRIVYDGQAAFGVALLEHCTIIVDRREHHGNRFQLCLTVAHEIGHLLGREHRRYRDDPQHVMVGWDAPPDCLYFEE